MSVISTGTSAGLFVKNTTDVLGFGATINSAGGFVSSSGANIRYVTVDPNGVVTANAGSLALRNNGLLYLNISGGSVWTVVTGVPALGKAGYQYYDLPSPIANIANNAASAAVPFPTAITFAANTFQVGSTIRIRGSGFYDVAVANSALTFRVNLGGLTFNFTTLALAFPGTYPITFMATIDFNAVGGAGVANGSIMGNPVNTAATAVSAGSIVDTTIVQTLNCTVLNSVANNGTNFDLTQFTVDVNF